MDSSNAPGTVELRREGEIARIEFAHPKSNCLTRLMLQELTDRLRELAGDRSVRVIVLASAGTGAFCAGAAFAEVQAIRELDEGTHFFSGFGEVILAIRDCPQLVVVRVQGKVVGGGVGLVAAADYAVAARAASARLSEFEIGLGPFVIGPAVERRIGAAAFGAMAIDCQWRDADWLYARGLYSSVTADQEGLDEAVAQIVGRLVSAGADATCELKQALWRGTDDWPELLARRAAVSGRCAASRNFS